MKIWPAALGALLVVGCAEVNRATEYVGEKPQKFSASLPDLSIEQLYAYRTEKYPGKLWVEPNPGRKTSAAFAGRQNQWTALFSSKVEQAYRAVALQALAQNPGGTCQITDFVPWPNQFAVEYTYSCDR